MIFILHRYIMSFSLKENQQLTLEIGNKCTVKKFIGSGGQGEVYEVIVDNESYALKWYFNDQATKEQEEGIRNLIKLGKPNESFLWPINIATIENSKSFGYIMELRKPNFKSLFDLMKNRVHPSSYTLAKATYNLANSFRQLHSKGLCYRDISHGNIFFHPDNGEILICDNDNVGLDSQSSHGVVGTPRFMAPEIVRAEASPNANSDQFSLATLLFYMLFTSHPLEGKNEADIRCFDQPAMDKIYGENPIFIFDPDNTTNRPVPGYHDNALIYWEVYPDFLKDIFTKAFTEGLEVNKRVTETEWMNALIQLKDSIFLCKCRAENFANKEHKSLSCWNCHTTIKDTRLQFQRRFVTIHQNTKLYDHHLSPSRAYELEEERACIATHPNDASIVGLKNLGEYPWKAHSSTNDMRVIDPQKSIVIKSGTTIDFGKIEAEII